MTLRCLNVFSRSRSGKQAATAAAPNTNRFKPVQRVAAGVAVQRVSVCVCICVAYLMRLCFTCMCVCSSPNRRVAPWTALTLFNWLCSLQNCHSHGKCEREADSLVLRLTVIAIAWHRFINWFLLWFSQLVRCGVCSFSKRTILKNDARFFVPTFVVFFFLFSRSSGYCWYCFRFLGKQRDRERKREIKETKGRKSRKEREADSER